MTCERYWREGVLLVEQGLPDLHRETCEACKKAHAARDELVRAVAATGPGEDGRADWQLRVWQQIAREEKREHVRRAWWFVGGGLAVAGAVAAVLLIGREPKPQERYPTIVQLEKGPIAKRGDAQVGDTVRAQLAPEDEVRIYRGSELVYRCAKAIGGADCAHDAKGSLARYLLPSAGDYVIVIVTRGTVEPVGSFDRDLAALVQANVTYRIDQELAVR